MDLIQTIEEAQKKSDMASFKIGDTAFDLTLIQKRKPK